jgi:hypothetical protein
MNRRLAWTAALTAIVAIFGAALAHAQGVFPPPPPPGQQGVFPAPPPPGQQSVFPAAPAPGQQGGFSPGPMQGGASAAQPPARCNEFIKLSDEAKTKAAAVQAGGSKKIERKEMCLLVTRFVDAEGQVVKFLADNKTVCGVPLEAVTNSKKNHELTIKFRDSVCAEAPKPKAPSLSEAIGTPTLDTAKNTKTGRGTFDTLTGNPLAK